MVNPTYIPPVENGLLQLDTTGLGGAFRVAADDLPPGFEIPAGISAGLPFEQQLQLVINLSLGVVEGRSRGRIPLNNQTLEFQTDVRGNATCLPRNGRECGQLVVVLELRGALSDPYDPTRVGLIETTLLGSLVRDDAGIARWVTLSGNTMLGGNEALISSVLEYAACKGGLAIC